MGRLQRLLWPPGETALPADITRATWQRFHNPLVPMFALLAEREGKVLGLVHYLFMPVHRGCSPFAICKTCSPCLNTAAKAWVAP